MKHALRLSAAFLALCFSDLAVPSPAEAAAVCEGHMAAASKAEGVPLGVLYAVGLTESGRKGKLHPFALNIEGKAVFPKSEAEALKVFASARRKGKKLIDLGCMQINHHYHGSEFASVEAMFDPALNVKYAARFLRELKVREKSWTMAVARYHAGPNNDPAQKRYICAVIRNLVATGFGNWTPAARKFCK